jgi:hypothetical protein
VTAEEIATYIRSQVPTFEVIRILKGGVAYHYTTRADEIHSAGRFLGAQLSPDLDCTQNPNQPNRASADPGVVFAYASLQEAAEEGDSALFLYPGRTAHVFRLSYSCAVEARHLQEAELDAPPTLLIPNTFITKFECLGICAELWDQNEAQPFARGSP